MINWFGELNGLETICHMIVSNNLDTSILQIPNPLQDSETIDIKLELKNKTNSKVSFVNGTPYIECNIDLKIKILSTTEDSITSKSNYFDKQNSELIEQACNEYLTKNIYKYLYKICKEYKCDIDGFGKYALKYFPTLDEWNEYNWLENFENSFFKIDVDSTLESGYSFI